MIDVHTIPESTVTIEFSTAWKIWLCRHSFTRNRSIFSLFPLIEQACWAQQREQETSARRLTWNKVRWNFNFFIGFTICPCAERYFRNGVCRLSYHASMRPLVWIRYSIGCPNRDAVLHMFCVVETHLKSLSRNENNDRVLLHLYLLRTSDKKRKLSLAISSIFSVLLILRVSRSPRGCSL